MTTKQEPPAVAILSARIAIKNTHHQAITTKFIGPTNCRGSRVKATCQAGSVTIGWDDALDINENHDAAARALAEKFGWEGDWVGGGHPIGHGNVYVCVQRSCRLPGESEAKSV